MVHNQIMTSAGIVALIALLSGRARGLDDSLKCLQVESKTKLDLNTSEGFARFGQLFTKSEDLQRTGADAALEYITQLGQSGAVEAVIKSGTETDAAKAPPKPLPLPIELVQIMAEMKTLMRSGRVALDPARFASSLKGKGIDFPANVLEEETRKAVELETNLWRHNTAAHDEILAYVPKLYGLLSQPVLFESLASAAKDSQHENDHPAASLAKHFPKLLTTASSSLVQVGTQKTKKIDLLDQEPWNPPPETTDPYIRFASHHGIRGSCKDWIGTFTVGYKNHFYKELVENQTLWPQLKYGKMVWRLGVYYKNSSNGHLFGGQVQWDTEGSADYKTVCILLLGIFSFFIFSNFRDLSWRRFSSSRSL
jgi:hypothetical protein